MRQPARKNSCCFHASRGTRSLKATARENQLMAALLYDAGLRLMECVRLRVKDIDFGYKQITVRME